MSIITSILFALVLGQPAPSTNPEPLPASCGAPLCVVLHLDGSVTTASCPSSCVWQRGQDQECLAGGGEHLVCEALEPANACIWACKVD